MARPFSVPSVASSMPAWYFLSGPARDARTSRWLGDREFPPVGASESPLRTPAAQPLVLPRFPAARRRALLLDEKELGRFSVSSTIVSRLARRARTGLQSLPPTGQRPARQVEGKGTDYAPYLRCWTSWAMGAGRRLQGAPSSNLPGLGLALKVLPPSFGLDPRASSASDASRGCGPSTNPNIVAALDVIEDRFVHFLAMEFIECQYLDALGGLPVAPCLIEPVDSLARHPLRRGLASAQRPR